MKRRGFLKLFGVGTAGVAVSALSKANVNDLA